MKKTISALMVLAGIAGASTQPTMVYSLEGIDIGTLSVVDISAANVSSSATNGVTIMLTLDFDTFGNGPAFWFSTLAHNAENVDTSYSSAAAIVGGGSPSQGAQRRLSLYKASAGSAGGTSTSTDGLSCGKTDFDTVAFVTIANNTATIFELTGEGTVVQTGSVTGSTNVVSGSLQSLVIGNWTHTAVNCTGSADIAFYNGVMTVDQMNATIPEPATATLSLLALAGLAARRRRK